MSRSWRIAWLIVAAMLVVVASSAAFYALYWAPRNADHATEEAKVALPVGSASFADVVRNPDRYVGEVLTLEGIVDDLWGTASVDTDPTDTTVYPPPDPMSGTIIEAAYYTWSHPWVVTDLWGPRSLRLSFLEPIPIPVHEGNTVSVVCRIVGERGTGFLETALEADVCRDLRVLDESTYEWSEELRSASERMRELAQDSVLIVGETPRSQFEIGTEWSLDAVTAFCEGSRTAVGHDRGETYISTNPAGIDELEALWREHGLQVRRFTRAEDLTAGRATLLEGKIESIGTITLRIADNRYSLSYETECL